MTGTAPLVEVRDLVKHFPVRGGILQRTVGWVQAVDGVSFEVRRGETPRLLRVLIPARLVSGTGAGHRCQPRWKSWRSLVGKRRVIQWGCCFRRALALDWLLAPIPLESGPAAA